jgi:protein TonB
MLIPQKKKLKKKEPIPKGQVVDLPEEIKTKQAPKQAKFLSKFNTKVKKETRARFTNRHKKPRHSRPVKRVAKVQSRDSKSLRPTKMPKKKARPMQNNRKAPITDKGVLFRGDRVLRGLKDIMLRGDREYARPNIQATVGRSSSNDAVLDRPKADETLLNSRHFKYWGFFQRVKEQIDAQWRPFDAVQEWDPHLRNTPRKGWLTKLRVTLDQKGNLLRSEIVKGCGRKYLDREALRAMKAAQPFVNPPKGLLDKYGRLTFDFWFLVDMTGRPVRMYWRP